MAWWLWVGCATSLPLVVSDDPGCTDVASCETVCDAGGAIACNRLALWLHDGVNGAALDPVRAAARYERSCDLGAGIGCFNLAHQLSGAQGIPADPGRAIAMMERAHVLYRASCDAGGLTWCTNLAGLLQRGEGVPIDAVGARTLYTSTCADGDALACLEQASMMEGGEGGPEDDAGSLALLQKTCDDGSPEACNNLALRHEESGRDPRPAFERSCDQGNAMACRNLAMRLDDPVRALALLQRACDNPKQFDGYACALAASWMAQGGDAAGAAANFQRACSVGVAPACLDLVSLAAAGAIPLPREEALLLLRRGCDLGDPPSCELLAKVGPPAP